MYGWKKVYSKPIKEWTDEEIKQISIPLKKSRKAYLLEYLSATILFVALFFAYISNSINNKAALGIGIFIGIIAITFAEVSRLMYKYEIIYNKVTITTGLFHKHQKHVFFFPLGFVPDVNVKQNPLQRILRYGTIYVVGADKEQSMSISDIDHPRIIMEIIERLLEENKEKKGLKEKSNEKLAQ